MAGTIVGKVVSPRGNPLSGANVTCNGKEVTTLVDGTYRLEELSPSTYTVIATIKGFEPSWRQVTVTRDEKVTLVFCLREAVGRAVIRGRMLDKISRKPISAGTVILILPINNKYANTDSNGYYEFRDLPADSYEIWTSAPLYEDERATATLEDGEISTIDFQCALSNRVEPPWG